MGPHPLEKKILLSENQADYDQTSAFDGNDAAKGKAEDEARERKAAKNSKPFDVRHQSNDHDDAEKSCKQLRPGRRPVQDAARDVFGTHLHLGEKPKGEARDGGGNPDSQENANDPCCG